MGLEQHPRGQSLKDTKLQIYSVFSVMFRNNFTDTALERKVKQNSFLLLRKHLRDNRPGEEG